MNRQQGASLRYRPELDGLRAVAVLAVLVHHSLQPGRFVGFVGVDVFFALSGYLITTLLLRERARTGRIDLRTFYVRRLLRLYPALLVMIAVTLPLAPWLAGNLKAQVRDSLVAASYTSNLFITHADLGLGSLAHTWSLSLEEQFYLVWPAVLIIAFRSGLSRLVLAWICTALAVASAVAHVTLHDMTANGFPVTTTAYGILAGSAYALFNERREDGGGPHRRRGPRAATMAGASILLASPVAYEALEGRAPDGMYGPLAVVATILLVWSLGWGGGFIHRFLTVSPLVSLGRISYGVYLWHFPLLLLVTNIVGPMPAALRFSINAVAAVGVAALSWRFVEKPVLRWRQRMTRQRQAVEVLS